MGIPIFNHLFLRRIWVVHIRRGPQMPPEMWVRLPSDAFPRFFLQSNSFHISPSVWKDFCISLCFRSCSSLVQKLHLRETECVRFSELKMGMSQNHLKVITPNKLHIPWIVWIRLFLANLHPPRRENRLGLKAAMKSRDLSRKTGTKKGEAPVPPMSWAPGP